MRAFVRIVTSALLSGLLFISFAYADGLLDGKSFEGTIGPSENPDLDDTLQFNDGHFWSDICTRCGFLPGPYSSEQTEDGIRFIGVLESESRGQFEYDGLVSDDGTIDVSIRWERKRWYWTSSREISFQGSEYRDSEPSLVQIRTEMQNFDPAKNPLCSRF